MPLVRRFIAWLAEMIAEAVAFFFVIMTMVPKTPFNASITPRDVAAFTVAVLFAFGITGYAVTTLVMRLALPKRWTRIYPLIIAPLLFLAHFQILNLMVRDGVMYPHGRFVFRVVGSGVVIVVAACISFALEILEGSRPLRQRPTLQRVFIAAGASVFCVPLLFVFWYCTAMWWAPMDKLTIMMPKGVRNTVSQALLERSDFGAKGFTAARRAVKLNPDSEDAWTIYCSTGVRDGSDLKDALEACSRAESMNGMSSYPGFHAQIIAEAYKEARRPCDGLPILKTTLGEEKSSNVSPFFDVGRLEATCGQMNEAEGHLRTVVRLRKEDLRAFTLEDRPPGTDGAPDTYEKNFRVYLSEARQNLSALLTLRHKDAEAFQMCRAALGFELSRCSCQFKPRHEVACRTSDSR